MAKRVCFLLTAFASFLVGQNAELGGLVKDPAGAAVPAASIEIRNQDTGIRQQTTTNGDGLYSISSLRPGNYLATVQAKGFKTLTRDGIVLQVEQRARLDLTLELGSVEEKVTVVGDAQLANTTDASVSTVVDRNFVENMPLNGRSFQSLIDLTPGEVTAKTTGYGSSGQFSVNGQRTDANYFSVDGVSANFGIAQGLELSVGSTAAGALPAGTSSGGLNGLVSIDAMQEFKIQTSTFAPEFGRTPGAQISIVTRSGTNQFHGTAFEYFRNDAFDARDWFVNYNNLSKPAERQNDFGGVFGGPIAKNHLFFFFSYEGLRLRLPDSQTVVVPSTTARAQAPANIQPLLNAFPVPTSNDGPLTGVFSASYSNPSTLDATSIRIDYALSSRISIFGRYNHAPSNSSERGNFFTLSNVTRTISNVDTLTTGATMMVAPSTVNEFRFNYSRNAAGTADLADNFGGAVVPSDSYLFQPYPQANSKNDNFFALFLPDTFGWYVGPNAAASRQQQLNFVDTVSWKLASHNLKAGFDYRRLSPIDHVTPYSLGYFFSGFAGALTDTASTLQVRNNNAYLVQPLFRNLSFFAQDTWQATANLTITYGIRWDYNPPPSATSAYQLYTATNLNNPANAVIAPPGTPLWSATHNNFAPRLGVAYRVRTMPGYEVVLRGGAGIFYDLGNNAGAGGVTSYPYGLVNRISNVQFPASVADAAPPSFTPNAPYGVVQAFDPRLKLPRVYEWNVSIQQSLGPNQSVTATYLGSAGRRLLRDELLNSLSGLNSNFTAIEVSTNDGYSNYDALQLQYQRRLTRGLQVLASYTWAHSLDNGSVSSEQTVLPPYRNIYNPNLDYGNSDFDVRHSFSNAITWNVPALGKSGLLAIVTGGWSFDSVFRANNALPVDILTGLNPFDELAGGTFGRPNRVPNQPLYLYGSGYPGGKVFNPAAFVNPPTGQQGDLGRNVLRGFGAWEEDFTLRREFPIHERLKLQFRAEFFNIFNHPNFGDPGTPYANETNWTNSALFGRSTATLANGLFPGSGGNGFSPLYQIGGPRSIELSMKLQF